MPFVSLRSAACSVIFLVLGLFGNHSVNGQVADPVESKLESLSAQAQAAQQRGDYAAAARSYEQLVKFRPDIAEIWANLGLMRQFMGDYSAADHDFQTALDKNSHLYVPNLFLGLNRIREHQPRAALPYLKSAVSLNKEDAQAALGLARAYSGVANTHNAARWFERATEINPRDPDAWYELGVSYLKLQDDAVMQLKKRAPDGVHARTLVADSFMEQGRIRDAIPIYERFRTEVHPLCLKTKLGLAYSQIGSQEKAKQALEEEVSDHTGCLLAYLGIARLALISGDFDEMLRQLHTVNEREPKFLRGYIPEVWSGIPSNQLKTAIADLQNPPRSEDPIARMFIESANSEIPSPVASNSEESALTRNKSLPVDPEKLAVEGRYSECADRIRILKAPTPNLVQLLEQCSFYAGNFQLTLQTSQRALPTTTRDLESLYWQAKSAQVLSANSFSQMNAIAPDSPKMHLLMAELHRAREEFPSAEQEYNAVLKSPASGGDEISARLGLADVYFHTSEDDRALGQLESVLKSAPSNAQAHALMGQVLVRLHRYDDAIPHLQLALSGASSPEFPGLHSQLAKCYAARGEYEQALQEIKHALPTDTMGDFHYQLYQIYQKLGDKNAAAEALRTSEQLRRQKASAEQQQTLKRER